MKFVKMILVSMMVLGFTGIVFAEDGGDELSIDFSTSYLTKYLSASGGVFYPDSVMQSILHFENLPGLPKGTYADIWHSWSPDKGHLSDDFGDELNYILGWTGKVGGIQVDIGASYLDLLDLGKGCQDDFLMLYVEVRQTESLSLIDLEISPFLRSETHIDLNSSPGDGIYLIAGIDNSLGFADNFSLDQRFAIIYDSGAYNFGAGWVGNYGVDLNWQISKDISIIPLSLKVYLPENSADGKGSQTIIGAGISIAF